jgi:hypothetical protein
VECAITARSPDGSTLITVQRQLAPGGSFRTPDIFSFLGITGEPFGPLTIEASEQVGLVAASQVYSTAGSSGFFPAVSYSSAGLQKIVAEIVDTGERGTAGTFRTNLGLNNLGPEEGRVTLELMSVDGHVAGRLLTAAPSLGLKQINNLARAVLGSETATGFRGYVRVQSSQPLHVWASKIDNGTDDPSIVIGVP